MIIFLDIDDTIAKFGQMAPEMVAQLNRIIAASPTKVHIVFNTAWNAHGEMHILKKMVEAGFDEENSHALFSKTGSCSGGGDPIRKWMKTSECIGAPYVIIDDSTHNLGTLWCRLARCNVDTGLTKEVADRVIEIMNRPITMYDEKAYATRNIAEYMFHIEEMNHLVREEKDRAIVSLGEIINSIDADHDFLRNAMLSV